MAKQIKTIQCPQCGSTQKTQIKDDYYKCSNCGTEYFLDNDDINVNVTHRIEKPIVNSKPIKSKVLFLFFLCIVLVTAIALFFNKKSSPTFAVESSILDTPIEVNGKLYLLTLSNKYNEKKSIYSFIDFKTKEVIKKGDLFDANRMKFYIQDSEFRRFSNGDVYIVINKQKVLKVDNVNMEVNDLTLSMFENDPLYKSGIANIDAPAGKGYGNCLKVMTNMGKEYYYFPLIKKSYSSDSISDASMYMKFVHPDSKEDVIYIFTEKKWSDMNMEKEDETQLLKVIYPDNAGGPSNTYFKARWDRKRGGQYVLDWWYAGDRIISYTNLTPGRLYFNPAVMYSDKEFLLVKTTATAAKGAPTNLQRINTTTGELIWSIPFDLPTNRYIYYYDRALHADKKFALKLSDGVDYLIVSDDGKDVTYFNSENL